MIATLVMRDGRPTVPLPHRALDELGLRPGQYVRIDVRPIQATPVVEPDGTPML